jgi:arylsulfatase A-like enzyme
VTAVVQQELVVVGYMITMSRDPNIIYILADDMGYGDISCLNPESRIRTEQIDRLADRGMKFTDAHSSSAVCTPSRYNILTGRYNWRSSLKHGVSWSYSPHLIEDGRTTVASYLKGHGYSTACIGKWHLGLDWHDADGELTTDENSVDFGRPVGNGPTTFGFDYFYGITASLDIPPYVYIENDRVTAPPNRNTGYEHGKNFWRDGPTGSDFFHTDVLPTLTRRATDWIRAVPTEQSATSKDPSAHRDPSAPFFLYVPLPAPHTPILPTAPFRGTSGTNSYGDFCLMVDWVVGEIARSVEETGQLENTIIVFTSDNGCSPNAGFEELSAIGHYPSYHFRGHKADIYDGGHRIPLVIQWPRTIPAGTTSDQIVCLGDFFATIADHLGDQLPDNCAEDSVSNLPIWRGTDTRDVREAIVHHSINGSFSIRQGRWKLEFCPGSGGWSDPKPGEEPADAPPVQLYDMLSDVGEQENVQHLHPDVVSALTELMTRYVREGRSTPGSPQENTGPRHWPQLNWMNRKM